jgi:NADH-quinone oxidoreductase subunit N
VFQAPEVQWLGIAPELALTATALVLLLADAFAKERLPGVVTPLIASTGLIAAGYFALEGWQAAASDGAELQLAGMIAVDGFAAFTKISLAVFGLLSVWLAREYLVHEDLEEAEYYGLVVFAVAGMMLMASAADLIVMFLALETFSIALYVLVGFRRFSLAGQESAMKYFLLGSFSSAFFLLGIAFVYGATGSTLLYSAGGADGITGFLATTATTNYGLLVLATALLIVGLGFKVAAVPFHMWTPDAYQGAPSPVTGFMAAASKFAGFAAIVRLLDVALFPLLWDWRPLVIGIAALTMVAGSVVAVVQEDVKRLLAYSSVAHAGFVFTGIIAANDRGVSGALFYLATYGLTVLGAFAVVAVLAGKEERRTRLADYRGLFEAHPVLAGLMTLFMLSLAGVPLTSGFVAKLVVFGAAIEAGYEWLVVVGVLASAIAAFFYLRVMVVMYMVEPGADAPRARLGPLSAGVIGLTALATLALGLYWGPLIDAAENARIFAGG